MKPESGDEREVAGSPVPLVMGILNVTPDSFSDGGRYRDLEAAVAHGRRLFDEGADIVDVGGESTRPGAAPVDTLEELDRILAVVEALAPHGRISVDTRKAAVADAALAAGATLLNDVSASLHDVAAAHDAGWVAMHMRGDPRTMQVEPRYDDVVAEVGDFLVERAELARAVGVTEVWIDPGLGFGKTLAHNLDLLAGLDELVRSGFPVLIGASRKAFLGTLLAASDARGGRPEAPVPADDRLEGSLAVAAWAIHQGARMVRVHDVRPTVEAVRVLVGGPGP